MATSVLDQIRTVEHQKVKVKTETLRKIKQALNELNKLGFDYRLLEMAGSVRRLGEARGPTKMPPAEFAAFAP